MKYILELEDEPNKEYFGEGNYYRCKQIPYWSISESMRNRLEPYDEADRKTEPSNSEIPNNCEPFDKDINVRSKDEPQTERKNLCGKQICDHLFDDDCALKTDCAWK